MSSPVFEAMLYGPLAEGLDLQIHDDPPEAFEWLLEYMYRGQTHLPAVPLTVQVYQLASKYQMEALMALCSEVRPLHAWRMLQQHPDLNGILLLRISPNKKISSHNIYITDTSNLWMT